MSNFEYLSTIHDFRSFSKSAIDAEVLLYTSPAMSTTSGRKALELAVKWIFNAERSLDYDPNMNLQGYVHDYRFRQILDPSLWRQIQFIIKTGNRAVHSDDIVTHEDAVESLKSLFTFIDWMSSRYLREYTKHTFNVDAIPKTRLDQKDERVREAEKQVVEMTDRIRQLESEIASLSEQYTAEREKNMTSRPYEPRDMSEYETRKLYIDADLRRVGWRFDGQQVIEEYEVTGMQGDPDQKGFVDYVLFGKDGLPLAVVEAKRSSRDPNAGREQAKLYADCLERKFRRRPMMFTTNGYETYFWDDTYWTQRKVSGLFGREDLQRLMNRRSMRQDLLSIPIDDDITNRYYQKEAIRKVCDDLQDPSKKRRKHLLVMATGTGKTRTAAGLIDVLTRGNHVTNVLFLADRTALVLQAMDSFRENLPHVSQCNLCDEKSDVNARIVFSTYQTIINRIDELRSKDGSLLFSPAHFDLIIIDECHRSIFRKFSMIFDYFDAVILGLTATPKMEVDRNTYRFFEMEDGIPSYVYEYDTAVNVDHYLVPFNNYEIKTRFLSQGIVYDDLSEKDKERYEEDFEEDGTIPDSISSNELNRTIFNISTVDMVLQDLMEHGIKIDGGDHLGKTIIFAQNKRHAEFIIERFNKLYPRYNGTFAKRVVCDDSFSQGIIYDFKYKRNLEPQIVVSVDMMDTGVDVPDCVNLVFFKVVRSHTKFFQMIGRGTRLCPGVDFQDEIDGPYTDKRRFLIFDYCGNFEFFRLHPEGYESKMVKSLTQYIFEDRITLIHILQRKEYSDDDHQAMRSGLVKICHGQIYNLNRELAIVRLKLEYVDRYSDERRFDHLGDSDADDLRTHLGPIIPSDEEDENAKFFDKAMYDIMIRSANGGTPYRQIEKIQRIGMSLEAKTSIPQVREKIDIIREVQNNTIWESGNILEFERVRMEMRDLMKFLDREVARIVTTDLEDVVESYKKGEPTSTGPSFEDYHKKVNRYILENIDKPAIFKLYHNQKLTSEDFQELERIFTEELGTRDDYENEFGNIGFGEMVRKIVKVDHQSLMDAFSEFLNDSSMNSDQIAFLHKIINYIEVEGMMDIDVLMGSPFDRPIGFMKTFDRQEKMKIINTIELINDNARV